MEEERIARNHRVLPGAELRQAVLDKVVECKLGFGRRHSEAARLVLAPKLELPALQVSPHLFVNLIFARSPSGGCLDPALRWPAVLSVKVPAPTGRFAFPVNKQAKASPLLAVERLHRQRLSTVGPGRELLGRSQELIAACELHATRCQSLGR